MVVRDTMEYGESPRDPAPERSTESLTRLSPVEHAPMIWRRHRRSVYLLLITMAAAVECLAPHPTEPAPSTGVPDSITIAVEHTIWRSTIGVEGLRESRDSMVVRVATGDDVAWPKSRPAVLKVVRILDPARAWLRHSWEVSPRGVRPPQPTGRALRDFEDFERSLEQDTVGNNFLLTAKPETLFSTASDGGGRVIMHVVTGIEGKRAPATGTVVGKVWESSTLAPIPAAEVRIRAPARTTTTDSAGIFRFEGVPLGGRLILWGKLGYENSSGWWIEVTPTVRDTIRLGLRKF
jgi:hypothetical protein